MKNRELNAVADKAANLSIPVEGITMIAFGELLMCDPTQTGTVVHFLHRKRVIWMSKQRGHVRIFPASMRPASGRPKAVPVNVGDPLSPELLGLLSDLIPSFLAIRVLEKDRPGGLWNENVTAKIETDRALIVEAGNVMAKVRRFAGKHPSIPVADIRDALWLDRPDLMRTVVEIQPELAPGVSPFTVTVEATKRMASNLEPYERVLRYIQSAGHNGIAAYEIAYKTVQAIKTPEVERLATQMENEGKVHVRDARKGGKGRKTVRLFDASLGEPRVTDTGRLIPAIM